MSRFVSPINSSPIFCCLWGWIEWGCLFLFTHLSSQSKNRSSFNRWYSSPVEDSTFNQCPSPAHTHLNLTGSLPNGSTERRPTSIDWIPHTPCVDRRRPTWAVAKRMYRMKINTDHMTQKASLRRWAWKRLSCVNGNDRVDFAACKWDFLHGIWISVKARLLRDWTG